jgi:hypothetical protein
MEETNMKKIIATVLAMVMALALCTTAFAITYGDLYQFSNNAWTKYDLTGKAITYTSPYETKRNNEFVSGTIGYYTVSTNGVADLYLVEVDANSADYRLTVDGKQVNLASVDSVSAITYTLKGTQVTYGGTVTKCGDVYPGANFNDGEGHALPLYVDEDGDYYKADTAEHPTYMLVGGKVISVVSATENTDFTYIRHAWEVVNSNKAADGTVTGTAKCTRCGQVATLTSKVGDIPTAAYSERLASPIFSKTVWVYWTDGTTTPTTPSTGNTTSPKTFDAGIAMYVGMALTSVAGSAVVKKKEF